MDGSLVTGPINLKFKSRFDINFIQLPWRTLDAGNKFYIYERSYKPVSCKAFHESASYCALHVPGRTVTITQRENVMVDH
jgi:hypothetical protein